MKRLLISLLLVLLPCAALAADYHLLLDIDGDGNADPCPNSAHQTHYSTDTTACGGTFDIDNDSTAETLYCDVQLAFSAANASGDTVEVHEGTFDNTDSAELTSEGFCSTGGDDAHALATVVECTGCTAEGDRRIFRGAVMIGATDPVANVIFEPGTSAGNEAALTVGQAGTDSVKFVSIVGITFGEPDRATCSSTRYQPIVVGFGEVDNLIIDDIVAKDNSTVSNCSSFTEAGPTALLFNAIGSGAIQDIEIKNSTLESCVWMIFDGGSGGNTDCGSSITNAKNIDIHDNTLTSFTGSSSALTFRRVWNMAFYNNSQKWNSTAANWRWRQSTGPFYLFNNYVEGGRGFFSHQDACGDVFVFNNTFYNQAQQVYIYRESGTLPDNDTMDVTAYNNSYNDGPDSYSTIHAQSTEFTNSFTTGYEHIDKASSIESIFSDGIDTDNGNYICKDAEACGANSAIADCGGGGGGCDNNQMTISGDAPWPLLGSEDLIGAGFNNPLAQGADVCSITLWTGHVIDCSVDYEGDNRGSVWDIGADEFAAGAGFIGTALSDGVTLSSGVVVKH